MMRTSELNLQTSRSSKVQSSPMAEGLGFPRMVICIEFQQKRLDKKNQKETNRQIFEGSTPSFEVLECWKIRSANYKLFGGNEMIQTLNEMGF